MSRIVAVVSTVREEVGGGAPMFFARNEQELEQLAFRLEKILDASAHELSPSIRILVKY